MPQNLQSAVLDVLGEQPGTTGDRSRRRDPLQDVLDEVPDPEPAYNPLTGEGTPPIMRRVMQRVGHIETSPQRIPDEPQDPVSILRRETRSNLEQTDEPSGPIGEVGRGIVRGSMRVPGQLAGMVEFVAGLPGARQAVDAQFGPGARSGIRYAGDFFQSGGEELASRPEFRSNAETGSVASLPGVLGEAVPQLGLQIGAAAATGGLGTAAQLTAFGATAAGPVVGDTYTQSREWLESQGVDSQRAEGIAAQEATINGLFTLLSERIGGRMILGVPGAKDGIRKVMQTAVGRFGVGAMAEGSQEIAEAIEQEGAKRYLRGDTTAFGPDFWKSLPVQGGAGVILGGGAAGLRGAPRAEAIDAVVSAGDRGRSNVSTRVGDARGAAAARAAGVPGAGGAEMAGRSEQGAGGLAQRGTGVVPEAAGRAERPAAGADRDPGAERAAIMLREAEAQGREDAAAGVDADPGEEFPPEVRRAYRRGYRAGQAQSAVAGVGGVGQEAGDVSRENARPRTGPADRADAVQPSPRNPVPGEIVATGEAPSALEEQPARSLPLRVADLAEGDVEPLLGLKPGNERVGGGEDVGQVPQSTRTLESMSNAELAAEAERVGVKPAKSRPTTIGRIRAQEEKNGRVQVVGESKGVQGQGELSASGVDPLSAVGGVEARREDAWESPTRADARQPVPRTGKVGTSNDSLGATRGVADEAARSEAPRGAELKSATPPREGVLRSIYTKADAIEQAARQRLAERGAIPRGRATGATTIPGDLVDYAAIAAAKALKAGVRTAEGLSAIVRETVGEAKVDVEAIRSTAARIMRRVKSADPAAADDELARSIQTEYDRAKIPAPSVKQSIRESTEKTVDPETRKQFARDERTAAAAFKEGEAAGKAKATEAAKPRETLKQRIARTTGIADESKVTTEAKALRGNLRAQARAGRAAYRAGRDAGLAKLEEELTRQDAKQAQRERVVELIRDHAPPEYTKRFLDSIATAPTTEKGMDSLAGRVLQAVAESRMRLALREAKQVLKGVKTAKMLEEHRTELREVKKELKALRERLNERGSKDSFEKLTAIRGELVAITARAQHTITQHRLAARTHVNGKAFRTEAAIREFIAAIEKSASVQTDGAVEIPESVKAGIVADLRLGHLDRSTIAEMVGSKVFRDLMVTQAHEGENAVSELRLKYDDFREANLKKHGIEPGSLEALQLSESGMGRRRHKPFVLNLNGRKVAVPPDVAMEVYALLTDDGARANLERGAPMRFVLDGGTKHGAKEYTIGNVESFLKSIPEAWKKIVDDDKRWYAENITPEEARVFRREFGYDLELHRGFHHTERLHQAKQKEMSATEQAIASAPESMEWTQYRDQLSSLSQHKSRDPAAVKAPYVVRGYFARREAMVRNAAAFIHMSQPVREMGRILDHQQVKDALANRWGSTDDGPIMLARMRELVADTQLVASQRQPQTKVERWFDAAKRNVARMWLPLGVTSFLRNLTGVVRVMNEFPMEDHAGAAWALSKRGMGEVIKRRAFFRMRMEQTAAVRASQSLGGGSDMLGRPSLMRLAKSGRLGPLIDRLPFFEWSDSRASVAAFGMAMHQSKRVHENWTESQHEKWALQRAEQAIRRTQNPSSKLDMSGIARRNQGKLTSGITMFANDGIAARNMLIRAHHSGSRKKVAKAYTAFLASSMASSGLVWGYRAALAALGAALLSDDDNEYRKTVNGLDSVAWDFARQIGGLVYGGGAVVDFAKVLVDSAQEKPTGDIGNPILGPVGTVSKGMIDGTIGLWRVAWKMANSENTTEQRRQAYRDAAWKASREVLMNGAGLAGVPVAPINDVRRFLRGGDSDPDRGIVIDKATEALRAEKPDEAGRALAAMLKGVPGEKVRAKLNGLESSLENRGPFGNLPREEILKRLRAMPPEERSAKSREWREWRLAVERAGAAAIRAWRQAKSGGGSGEAVQSVSAER